MEPSREGLAPSSISISCAELLAAADPIRLKPGMRLIVTDRHLASPETTISTALQQACATSHACLATIPSSAVRITSLSPLCLDVLQSFDLIGANRRNWLAPPRNLFAFRQIASLHRVQAIPKGVSQPWSYASSQPNDIETVAYRSRDGTERTLLDMLLLTNTDSVVIVREGKIIYEKYFRDCEPHHKHIQFSVTKSLVGLITAHLVDQGVIDPERRIADYIPELAETAFSDARVVEVLDMTTGVAYNEEYANPLSDVARHLVAAGYVEGDNCDVNSQRAFLRSLTRQEGKHNAVFRYISANSEVLSWLVEKATASAGHPTTVTEIFRDRIWSKIGAEHDAEVIVDSEGVASWAGGFNATTRDMARIGQLILQKGNVAGSQLLSASLFDWLLVRDTRAQFEASGLGLHEPTMAGWSYRNQFWFTNDPHGAFMALGIHGQMIYVDPVAKVVIAKNSSQPRALGNPLEYDVIHAISALARSLMS